MKEKLRKLFHRHNWRYYWENRKRICRSCKEKQTGSMCGASDTMRWFRIN